MDIIAQQFEVEIQYFEKLTIADENLTDSQ